jgi:hypothetical protein
MRTLPETAAYLKEQDPQTAITLTALRRMVKTGELPPGTVGVKRLINLDILISHLNSTIPQSTPQIPIRLFWVSEEVYYTVSHLQGRQFCRRFI